MAKYLYEVTFERGRSNPEFQTFLDNVMSLNAKAPDYAGINNLCVISHHMDSEVVYTLCSDGLKKSKKDLLVTEITKKTLRSNNSSHRVLSDLVDNYFLPHNSYPNIE